MKWISILVGLLITPAVFAVDPVTLSGPSPAIASSYAGGALSTVIYTLTNNVSSALPVTVSGISNGISRTTVANDCGGAMPAGPSTCNIGIAINPSAGQVGSRVSQTLIIDYQGRTTLTSPISFSVIEAVAYVTPFPGATTIQKFSLDPTTGAFVTNTTAYTAVSGQYFEALTFATVGGVQYAYIVDQSGFVYQCTINADGTFNTCTATPASPPSWEPYAIAFAKIAGVQYAYVTDVGNDFVFQCSLNVGGTTNGTFDTCITVQGSNVFQAPYGISFGTVGGTQYAYVADAGAGGGAPGSVYQCPLDSSGAFTTCTAQPVSSAPSWFPYAVTFGTSNGTQYAYVADNGVSVGSVYQCTLHVGGLSNGNFETCTATPSTSPPSPNVPSQLAFATLSGQQYAYVTNYQGGVGGVYWCTVDSNGTFSNCNPTTGTPPITGWTPVGLAFRF